MDRRSPADVKARVESAHGRVLRAEEFQLVVLFWCSVDGGTGYPTRHRHLVINELSGFCRAGVCIGRIYHARCRTWVDYPLCPLYWGLGVFYRRIHAHVSRTRVRFIQGTSRISLGIWNDHLRGADGRSLPWLRSTLGANVLLGCAGDYFAVWRHTLGRRRYSAVDSRRLFDFWHYLKPFYVAARGCHADHIDCAGGDAHHRPPRCWVEQPRRRFD